MSDQSIGSDEVDHKNLYQNLNYSERLFLSRSIERKKKIDLAFNSISDTTNQDQISQALKQMTEVNERKELITKIIKRKKEIQKMKEINTINSLAPLFSKIKNKFFNNLYKKTGNQQYLLMSQRRNAGNEEEINTIIESNQYENEEKQNDSENSEEQTSQDESFHPNQLANNVLVNNPLIENLKIIKKQHLFNALTLLATTRTDSKKKQNAYQSKSRMLSHSNSTYLQLGENKLQYLTKDPNIFKAETQYSKEQKKSIENNNNSNNQNNSGDGQGSSIDESKSKINKQKQQQQQQQQLKVKAKVDHRHSYSSLKNQIITNHTSLQNLLKYESNNVNPSISSPTNSDFTELQKRNSLYSLQIPQSNPSENNTEINQNNHNQLSVNYYTDTTDYIKQNSSFKESLKSSQNSFLIQDYLPGISDNDQRKNSSIERHQLNHKQSTFKNQKNSFLINDDAYLLKDEYEDQNKFTKGLPKVSNFGGHYYYLGKEIPQSNLYRFIVQCEQKRIYCKSDGNLFSNKPFSQDLNSINKIPHIHKIVDPDTKEVSILELKHYPDSCTFRKSNKKLDTLQQNISSTPTSKQSSFKGLPSLQTNSYLFQKKQTDNSDYFFSNLNGKSQINNTTKDTDSILSTKLPDNLKNHIIKGYYSCNSKPQSINTSLKKQYFVKINNKKIQ